jgi:sugar phosphate isomerase/epimerase
VTNDRFAISTFLFHQVRLDREHLVEVAAHGFEAIELFALRSHFDYTDPGAIAQLAEWLSDTGISLSGVHAPTADAFAEGRWHGTLSIASSDEHRRREAVAATSAAIDLATTLPYPTLPIHVGVPSHLTEAAADRVDAARRSLDELTARALGRGVQLALEVQPNALSTSDALVALIEDAADWPPVGICVDSGHARLVGDPVDSVEAASGYVVATHLHDTRGTRDDHLPPYEGAIDWERLLMAFQKVGYSGPWTLELAPLDTPHFGLERAASARDRIQRALGFFDEHMSQ